MVRFAHVTPVSGNDSSVQSLLFLLFLGTCVLTLNLSSPAGVVLDCRLAFAVTASIGNPSKSSYPFPAPSSLHLMHYCSIPCTCRSMLLFTLSLCEDMARARISRLCINYQCSLSCDPSSLHQDSG